MVGAGRYVCTYEDDTILFPLRHLCVLYMHVHIMSCVGCRLLSGSGGHLTNITVIDFLEEMLYLANCESLQISLLPQTDVTK